MPNQPSILTPGDLLAMAEKLSNGCIVWMRYRQKNRGKHFAVNNYGITHLKRKTMQEKIDAYFDGYRRIPDGDDPDFLAMEKIGVEDLASDEEWPEAPTDAQGD